MFYYREAGSESFGVDEGLEVSEERLVSSALVFGQEIARGLKQGRISQES